MSWMSDGLPSLMVQVLHSGARAESKSKTSWRHVSLKKLVSVVLEDVVDMSGKISFLPRIF